MRADAQARVHAWACRARLLPLLLLHSATQRAFVVIIELQPSLTGWERVRACVCMCMCARTRCMCVVLCRAGLLVGIDLQVCAVHGARRALAVVCVWGGDSLY